MAGIDSRDFKFESLFNQKMMYLYCSGLVIRDLPARQKNAPQGALLFVERSDVSADITRGIVAIATSHRAKL